MLTTTGSETPVNIGIMAPGIFAGSAHELSVFVIFTSVSRTLKALEKAQQLAKPVGANIWVVAVQAVPFPLQLDAPPVSFEFLIKRIEEKACEYAGKIRISVYLCRDPMEVFRRVLNLNSPVVIGIRKKWLPRPEERLARRLVRAGYDVILVRET